MPGIECFDHLFKALSIDILKGNHVLTQVNGDGVCYLVPPLAFCRKDWLWKMPAEAMSDMQRQLHATGVCLVRFGMRACGGTIAQARRRACCVPACCLRRQYGCQICPWEKKRCAELKKELCFVTIFPVVVSNFTFYMKK